MHERTERILDTGHAEPNGRRGVVVCYPRSHDYFRRLLARVSADHTPVRAADDPAAKLLSMVQCVLASHTQGRTVGGGPLNRAAMLHWTPEPRKETEPCSD